MRRVIIIMIIPNNIPNDILYIVLHVKIKSWLRIFFKIMNQIIECPDCETRQCFQ